MSCLEFFGRGSINELSSILSNFGAKKIFLITGKGSFDKYPVKEKIEFNLKSFIVYRHSDFAVNPTAEDLIKGANIVSVFNPDAIVAIGGGSVLDTAKLLSCLPVGVNPIISIIKGQAKITARQRKLVLIPTTSGSGSEATHFAVAYIDKVKYSIASKYLLSDAVILDSKLTDTMPKTLTAITAFDAFCQAVESFWSVGSTKESRQYARESIKIVLEVFKHLMDTPSSSDRDKMMRAAFLAGKAINISKTTAPHAFSYVMTQYFGVPHGLAVMLLLPIFFQLNTTAIKENLNAAIDFNEYIHRIDELKAIMEIATLDEGVDKINRMLLSAGFKRRLRDYGIKGFSDINFLADRVNVERLENNPVIFNKRQLMFLLKSVY